MKVIKRDGRIVEFDNSKIQIAIEKANNEVQDEEKATKKDIEKIIEYIEKLNKRRILVEDIQDIIEKKLMELGKYELAKKYIVYRYTRALVRKSNTTDESILGLIRNKNKDIMNLDQSKNAMMASSQRNLIAGEVSKDLTKRILLPEKITKAWEEEILYFHNADYFVQPIINSCLVNIEDMLDNGTVINEVMIESPKSFEVACTLTARIIVTVASNQYGEQTVDMIHLGKYLRKSKEKFEKEIKEVAGEKIDKKTLDKLVEKRLSVELSAGVQTLQYEMTTLISTTGQAPAVTLFLHLDPADECLEENAMIIEEILKQRVHGMKDKEGNTIIPKLPKLIYVLDEINKDEKSKYYYLTKYVEESILKGIQIEYIESKKLNEKFKTEGRFNQGVVSINLVKIASDSEGNEETFWKKLDEGLELCKEALMCRHYALHGTISDISPILWRYGAIARLDKGEKIDKLLYNNYSSLTLGYMGIYDMGISMKGETSQERNSFENKVLKYLKNVVDTWKSETNIGFILADMTTREE